jgi:hypothetical protein
VYKRRDGQINFDDFNQPLGLELDPNNRWIKKSKIIPWDEIEEEYSSLFQSREGNVAKPARLALGALIIQTEYDFSDEETAAMIQENPYFQYFCGLRTFSNALPFDPSLMVYFRKRFSAEVLARINEKIIKRGTEQASKKTEVTSTQDASQRQHSESAKTKDAAEDALLKSDDTDCSSPEQDLPHCVSEDSDNKPAPEEPAKTEGTLIVDATCAPLYIKYPTDTDLLNKARENTERIISAMHDPAFGKRPRTHARIARKEYVCFSKKRKKSSKEIRRMIFKQLGYLKRNLGFIDTLLAKGTELPVKWVARLDVIRKLYAQQKFMYDKKTHSVPDRIVSLSQPWVRPIVRGKTKAPVEFGPKLDISVVDGFTRLEEVNFSAYNESGQLIPEIERFKSRTGLYPARVLADKIYRNRENLKYCKVRGIRLTGPALGRRAKGFVPDKRQEHQDMCDRIEVERAFSLAKRRYGLGLIYTRLQETTLSVVALSIMLLNLNKVLFYAQLISKLLVKMAFFRFTLPRFGVAVQ